MLAQLLADAVAALQASIAPEGTKVTPVRPRTAQDEVDRETSDFDDWLINDSIEWVEVEDYRDLAAEGDALAGAEQRDDGSLHVIAIPRHEVTPTTE